MDFNNMNLCPVLRLLIPEDYPIWMNYEEWRNHYESCEECNLTDWYEPDLDYLCKEGNRIFDKWNISTFSTKEAIDELTS